MTDQIEFLKPGKWVMRITADRRIEVNEGVAVTEAAQTVLEAVQQLLNQPEQRKPLTDADIKLVMDGRGEEGDDDYIKPAFDPYGISEDDLVDFARAIEQAHGIKETP